MITKRNRRIVRAAVRYRPVRAGRLFLCPDLLVQAGEMIERLGDIVFAEKELWPGYRIIDAVRDAIKELQII